ncbi:MAG TPA: PAS domain-containing protein [Mucilaginibacter sp.]|jgi:hypothetical protein|nr:PAS domain-containing protein [Mucilaginibacter sp.]
MTVTYDNNLEVARICEHVNFNKGKKELNELVALTADILETPIAVISVMNYEKQFIKDSLGTDFKPGSREISFCRHFSVRDEMKIIPDTAFDKYLDTNFLAPGNSSVRFYAGIPLVTANGLLLGSFCLFDRKPRRLSPKQKKLFAAMARQMVRVVETELILKIMRDQEQELKKRKEEIVVAERKLKAFFKSSAFCHVLIGKDLEIIDFNKATALLIKEMHGKNVQTGRCILEYVSPQYKKEFMICLTRAFAGKRINKETLIRFENKEPTWWNIFVEPIKNENGKVISVVYNATDINDQKQRIAEIVAKNALLSDIARVQSHDYRRPVASILGLMEVIRMQNQPLSEELQMMDEAVKELDQKIRSVINFTQILSSNDILPGKSG